MWPVILRELRASSRRWTTYWLRLLGAGAVLAITAWWLSSPISMMIRQPGREVFLQMHRVILVAIAIVVPLMTADCLSREKREGTLGLLFLTNLRAWNIVFAKGVAAALTALTLWLSVIPITTVPLLLGGLPASEIFLSCNLALASLWCALAAGMLASSSSRTTAQAVRMALTISCVGLFCLLCVVPFVLSGFSLAWFRAPYRGYSVLQLFVSGCKTVWNLNRGVSVSFQATWLVLPLFSFAMSCFVALWAARQLHRNWQDKPKTKRQTEVENFFCAPVFWTGLFRWWMRRSLSRNPIGWLERRSWTGRITAWIALAIMISFASAFAYAPATRDDYQSFDTLMWMLLIGIAYVAGASFRRERETGAMELMLVTPLSERQIISGRLRGLWNQYLPSFIIWVAVVCYLSTALKYWPIASLLRFTILYLIVPIVGLYFSLRSRFVLLAWLATMATCYLVPHFFWWAFYFVVASGGSVGWRNPFLAIWNPAFIILPMQLVIAALLLWRLQVNLRRRSFSLR